MWSCNEKTGEACGNPLRGNIALESFRRSHRVYLSQIDKSKLRARPLSLDLVCEHAVRFWFGGKNFSDLRDVILHTVLLTGLNLGLRYDEIAKMKMENVSVHPGIDGTGSIKILITERTKNSTKPREYQIREWPAVKALRHSVLVDPFVAFMAWLCIRGNRSGFVFCEVSGKGMVDVSKPWSSRSFTEFFRSLLRMCGCGSRAVDMYSGHSLKRGCIQLYRSLDIRDEQIMQIVQMTGPNAYSNYCAANNDCAAEDLPRFSSVNMFMEHSDTLRDEEIQTSERSAATVASFVKSCIQGPEKPATE